jgi:hypothetical protein
MQPLRGRASIVACWKGITLRICVSLNMMTAHSAREGLALVEGAEREVGSAPCQPHPVAAFGTSRVVVGSEFPPRLLLLK